MGAGRGRLLLQLLTEQSLLAITGAALGIVLAGALLVGLVALGLVPLIVMRIVRELRTGQLPIYRTMLHRDGNGPKYYALLAVHVASLVIIGVIAADLLLGLDLRARL